LGPIVELKEDPKNVNLKGKKQKKTKKTTLYILKFSVTIISSKYTLYGAMIRGIPNLTPSLTILQLHREGLFYLSTEAAEHPDKNYRPAISQ